MENFDWTSFTKKIAVKAPITEIYNAWTKAGELEKWFLEKVFFTDNHDVIINADINVTDNANYEWRWYLYADTMRGRIDTANGKDFIRFTFEGECLVDVKLTVINEYTVVELRQYNIPTDEQSKQHIRLGCANGWTFYLLNLKSVYEGGIDMRNKDKNLPPMINN